MSNDWGNGWEDSQWSNGGGGGGYSSAPTPQPQQNNDYNSGYGQGNYYQQQQQQGGQGGYGDWGQQQQQPQQGYGQQGFGFQQAQQFMQDPMMRAAQQFGGQFAEQQKEKLSKYLGQFQLKYYFAVDNSYVGKKLGLLFFPFLHSEWGLKYGSSSEPVPAREDVNAPDLYIPLMAFLTYVLVSGFVLGTQGRFSPEMLGILTSNAFIWIILENVVILVAKYMMNISAALSVWHSLAYSTYKFVGMIACLVMFIGGGKTAYYCTLAYTATALVFFLLRTVKNFVFDVHNSYSGEEGRKRKLILILFILFSQPLIMWWLTSGVTSFDYSQFSFAQMAMDRMGLKKGLPMTDDGDVDYEALLKMPK